MLLPWLHFLNAQASSLIFLIRRLSLFHKNTPAGYGNASSPADCGMSSPTRPAVQQIYVLGQFGSRPRSCSCCVFPAEPPLEEKTCFNGRLCLYMIRSNRQCEPGTTKAPWIYWQPRKTLFVLCSLSEAPFSALFARYRSAKVDGAPSCWFVSSYRFFFFHLD